MHEAEVALPASKTRSSTGDLVGRGSCRASGPDCAAPTDVGRACAREEI